MEDTRKDDKCFFCQHKDSKGSYTPDDCVFYSCPFCGDYKLSRTAKAEIENCGYKTPQFFLQLAALATERNLQDRGLLFLGTYNAPQRGMVYYKDFLNEFPQDFRQQYDRALLNIARLAEYSPLKSLDDRAFKPQFFFCYIAEDRDKLLQIYKKEGLVDFGLQKDPDGFFNFSLTLKGFDYVRKIEADVSAQKLAFVAMWFDEEMSSYTNAVAEAVRQAGYEPYIANKDHHNDFIMSKVMNKIHEARFLIADLTSLPEKDARTGVRGGVYFEAGYAKGLGKEVILTCRDEEAARIHFDLKQFFSIYWHEENKTLKAWEFDFIPYLANHTISKSNIDKMRKVCYIILSTPIGDGIDGKNIEYPGA